uniref:Uncharacterized protein n=1 Tax=Anser cygnoides TaxID=8845 RepID=A0A8B9DR80_ANSCY
MPSPPSSGLPLGWLWVRQVHVRTGQLYSDTGVARFPTSLHPLRDPDFHVECNVNRCLVEVAVLWLLAVLGSGSGGKVLVWPVDNSHWLNVEYILKELVARGHEVTVLLPSCFLILNATQHSPFHFEVVEVPISKKEMAAIMDESFYFWFYEERELPVWESVYKIVQLLRKLEIVTKTICDGVLRNKMLMERLRASAFDVLVADPLVPSGELFAEMLGIPFVYTIRFSIGNTVERLCGGLPAPPSYVPAILSRLTDKMSFMERLKNIGSYALQDFMYHYLFWGTWDQYYSDVLGKAALTYRDYTFLNSFPSSEIFHVTANNPGKYKPCLLLAMLLQLKQYWTYMFLFIFQIFGSKSYYCST